MDFIERATQKSNTIKQKTYGLLDMPIQAPKRQPENLVQQRSLASSFNRPPKLSESTQRIGERSKLGSNISNLSRFSTKPAPSYHHKKYIQTSENVFYEERYEARLSQHLTKLMYFLFSILGLLGLLFLAANWVTPYEGPPPKHGYVRNKVIYCDFGYERVGNECFVQNIYNVQAENIVLNAITDLKIQYGDADCGIAQGFPKLDLEHQIEENSGMDIRRKSLLLEQVRKFLQNGENQQIYRFGYSNGSVWPLEKMHSYSCRLQLLWRSGIFLKILGGLVILAMAYWYISRWLTKRQTAKKIYQYLKRRCEESEVVNISEERESMNGIGNVDEETWKLVDSMRVAEQKIGYYEDDNLYWKRN